MKRIIMVSGAAILLLAAAFGQAPNTVRPLPGIKVASTGKMHTAVRLLADVRSIQPGSRFTAGVLMTMDPGWHTYWKNAGEAGLPTTIRWTLPDGITAGEIQWPIPEKHIEPGDILTYGYANKNMLLIPMQASASLKPGEALTLKGEVSWLECRTCLRTWQRDCGTEARGSRRQHPQGNAEFFKDMATGLLIHPAGISR